MNLVDFQKVFFSWKDVRAWHLYFALACLLVKMKQEINTGFVNKTHCFKPSTPIATQLHIATLSYY